MTATMGTRDVYLAAADEQEARAPRGWSMIYSRKDGSMHGAHYSGYNCHLNAAAAADKYVEMGAAVRAFVVPGDMAFKMMCEANWKAQRDLREASK